MAKSFGCDDDAANELVQGMYIRLTKYVDKVDKISSHEHERFNKVLVIFG